MPVKSTVISCVRKPPGCDQQRALCWLRCRFPGRDWKRSSFCPQEGTATVNWHLPAGVLRRYELLRSVDDAAAQVIFQSEDPEVASFTDVLIEGNRRYTYRLRNTMDRDVVLESRDIALHTRIKRRLDFNIVEAPNVFVALTPAAAFGSPAPGVARDIRCDFCARGSIRRDMCMGT